jgi:hypothetical protein
MFVIIASLRIFKVYDYSDVPQDQVAQETGNFLAEWLPYFLAMVMLNANLYQKGAFVGKRTDGYISVVDVYSQFVAALDGRRIHALTPFCSDYNDNALKSVRESIMHAEGLTYEQFIDEWEEKGEKRKALRFMTGKEMKAIGLTLRQRWAVVRARNYKVHGINVNTLLSSQTAKDPTNIGANEKQMATQNTVGNTATVAAIFTLRFMKSLFIAFQKEPHNTPIVHTNTSILGGTLSPI